MIIITTEKLFTVNQDSYQVQEDRGIIKKKSSCSMSNVNHGSDQDQEDVDSEEERTHLRRTHLVYYMIN